MRTPISIRRWGLGNARARQPTTDDDGLKTMRRTLALQDTPRQAGRQAGMVICCANIWFSLIQTTTASCFCRGFDSTWNVAYWVGCPISPLVTLASRSSPPKDGQIKTLPDDKRTHTHTHSYEWGSICMLVFARCRLSYNSPLRFWK